MPGGDFHPVVQPEKIRRQLLNAIKDLGDETYRLTVEEDGLTIGTILPEPEDAPEEDAEQESGDGFHDIFPEEPPQLADTVIPFNKQVKIVESAEFSWCTRFVPCFM